MTRNIIILEMAAEIMLFDSSISHKKAKELAENILTERLEKYKIVREIDQESGEYERDN